MNGAVTAPKTSKTSKFAGLGGGKATRINSDDGFRAIPVHQFLFRRGMKTNLSPSLVRSRGQEVFWL
jgi:hypothetical protein